MKKRFQLIALLAVALLGACSGGKDKVAADTDGTVIDNCIPRLSLNMWMKSRE